MLPDELLLTINEQFPCRDAQIQTLLSLLSTKCLVIHGLEATGKSSITRLVLETLEISHAIIDSKECITGRQLLEQTVTAAAEAVDGTASRCENLATLQVQLSELLKDERLVLVFDGIDGQREAPPTLIPALARIAESIPNLTLIFILSTPSARYYHTTGIPHVHFPPYTREESIQILSLSPQKIFPRGWDPSINYTEEQAAEDDAYVWGRFCGVVWDTIAKGAARDLVSFRNVCLKLWPQFSAPIVDGTFGTRDFARLMVSRRSIFQDESVLIHSVMRTPTSTIKTTEKVAITPRITHELPYYAKFILCAAYLASFNPTKSDPIFFMKTSDRKKKKRATGASAGKPSKVRRIPRSMLAPSPFPLDRLLAIVHAIVPHSVTQSADLLAQIKTLESLRLIVRAGAMSGSDAIDGGSRWRVNCGWEFVASLARSTGFEIRDYVASSLD